MFGVARAADTDSVVAQRPLPLRRRVARLGWLAFVLSLVAVGLLVVAVLVGARADPKVKLGFLPVGPSDDVPSLAFLLAAALVGAGVFVGLAALYAAAAMRVLARDRRIPSPLPRPLRELRGALLTPVGPLPPGRLPDADAARPPLRLTVLVPAHDEELTIVQTLASLHAQTRPPDRIVVVADNCTDRTEELARAHGAEVFATVGNTEKKAGALNQVLAELFGSIDARDVAMIMDADSVIVPEFLAIAMGRLEADPDLIAVGGVFLGEHGSGLVGQLQRNEFTRYRREIARRKGRVFVLTGTASLFRTYALKTVADSRGELLPGDPGTVYDTLALTEDNEMTLSLKTLGAKMVSPMQCHVVTEVMPDWHALWRQRMRWQRGALENIGAYGLTRATLRYWWQQTAIGYGTIALNAYLLLVTITLLAADSLRFAWFWLGIGMIFVLERVVTVWPAGWKARLIALPLFIEIGYDLVLQAVYVKSLLDIASGRKAGWNYVPREARPTAAAIQ
jgi:cellulose synthase/poly-beta-1,6-N-acetylglucosamine synthase-like glycosyltransferase